MHIQIRNKLVLCCAQSRLTLCNLRTIDCQAPLSIGLSRQEYWSGLPCSPSGDLPHPGIKPVSLVSLALQAGSLPTEPPGKPTHSFDALKSVKTPDSRHRFLNFTNLLWALYIFSECRVKHVSSGSPPHGCDLVALV